MGSGLDLGCQVPGLGFRIWGVPAEKGFRV